MAPRKTNRQSWSEIAMAEAIKAVSTGEFGYLKASKVFSVPKSTLERRVKGFNKQISGSAKGLGSRQQTFSIVLEEQLVAYIKNMECMLFGLTTTDVRRLAYQFAERNNIRHFFNANKKMAGWVWLRAFMKRNRLSLRTPEATSAARARGFNRVSVDKFFELLEPLQDKNKYTPSRIFNVDETGMSTVQGHPSKIIAMRDRKQVGTLSSAERGTLSTAVICMSASGSFIPPMMIYPRVRNKEEFSIGVPPETLVACHPSGWMQLNLFDHFVKHSMASVENPALLIMDGHKTHTQNIAVIEKARNNGVTILCLPPHCSHRMQPLDVAFMGPLSTFYNQEVEIFLRNNPGRVVTIF
ncbi:hypothetical protein PPYR_06004, partial [Photinus pyralis]